LSSAKDFEGANVLASANVFGCVHFCYSLSVSVTGFPFLLQVDDFSGEVSAQTGDPPAGPPTAAVSPAPEAEGMHGGVVVVPHEAEQAGAVSTATIRTARRLEMCGAAAGAVEAAASFQLFFSVSFPLFEFSK
jgi:hypothetical protein